MGSSIAVLRTDKRNRLVITQVRQENVRLQARIERLSAEATRLRAEINNLVRERQAAHGVLGNSTLRLTEFAEQGHQRSVKLMSRNAGWSEK